MFNVASWAAKVEFVALVNNDKFVLVVLIKPSCDVRVELIFDTEVFKLLIFTVLLTTSTPNDVRTALFVITLCLS